MLTMRNIKLTIAYDGTKYNGWQTQQNGDTIQSQIENAIKKVFDKKHTVYGAGRTDAGVHARGQTANFKTSSTIPITKIPHAINAILPSDIAVSKAEEMNCSFHSRYDAKKKHYRYYIFNSKTRDPFKENNAWTVGYKLNLALIKREANCLVGKHDFKSFQAKDKKDRSSVRAIKYISIKKKNSDIIIDIVGDGFLYNMVRNIVGTLMDIARGYLPEGSMKKILKMKDRTKAGPTAPAKGLFLIEVEY